MSPPRHNKYQSYQETASPWMGMIPSDWRIDSLKAVLLERKEANKPVKTKEILSLTMEKGVVPYSERGGGGNKHKDDLTAYKLAYPGDIVLNSMNVVVGSVGLSKYFGAVSPVYYMLRPRRSDESVEYFNYIFQSKVFQQSLLGLGNGIMMKQAEASGKLNTIRMRIPMGKLNSQPLPRPSPSEQTKIAQFLDYETAKIDALVEKQQQLIALLKEKRQAVISHAVTKGLNPNAPMRDSGIEWLGEVPAHWTGCPLKKLFNIKHGYAFDGNDFVDTGKYILMTPGNFMEKGGFRPKIPEKYFGGNTVPASFILHPGDLLVAMTEQGPGLLGCGLFVPEEGKYLHNQRLGLIKIKEKTLADESFLYHLFNSERYRTIVHVTSTGSKVKHTSSSKILSIKVALPAIEEQRTIAQYITNQIENIDKLEEKSLQKIDLLQERRTALISAAVTGKIDVRDWQPPVTGGIIL